jgi:hypothetical protein
MDVTGNVLQDFIRLWTGVLGNNGRHSLSRGGEVALEHLGWEVVEVEMMVNELRKWIKDPLYTLKFPFDSSMCMTQPSPVLGVPAENNACCFFDPFGNCAHSVLTQKDCGPMGLGYTLSS